MRKHLTTLYYIYFQYVNVLTLFLNVDVFICIIAKFQKCNKGLNFYCYLFKNLNEAT